MEAPLAEIRHAEILIIGSGPAGWTAAVYAARSLRETLVVTGMQPGGQLTITTDVENWPGEAHILGPDLMVRMQEHAEKMGAKVANDHILSVDFASRPFKAIGENGTAYTADAVIISTGAQAKWLDLPSEQKFKGFGVSACATCDGFFYRGREVMVIGGGNTAVEEALFLTNFASKVTVVHRRDHFRAEKILQDRLFKNPKVEVIWDSALEDVLGDEQPLGVTAARIKNIKTGAVRDIPVHGIFIAIGHAPSTELFVGKMPMRPNGYLITEPGSARTAIPGVFAAGDVTDETYRQAVTAAGMGCMAALEAERWLSEEAAHAGVLAAQ